MRIQLITGDFPPKISGIGDYTCLLAENLRRANVGVQVLTTSSAMTSNPCGNLQVSRSISDWNASAWPIIRHLLTSQPPNVVHIQFHTFAFGRNAFIQWLPFKIRCAFPKIKIVTTYHEVAAAGGRAGLVPMMMGSHANLLTNDRDRDRFARILPEFAKRRFHYIPLAPNISRAVLKAESVSIRKTLGLSPDAFLISRFGFLHEAAAAAMRPVLKALSLIIQEKPNAQLIWLGESTVSGKSTLDYWAGEFEVRNRVHHLGSSSAEEISAYLQSSDIAVAPYEDGISERRSSFLVLLSHGLPIIASRGSHIPRTLSHRENVFLVPHAEAESWRDAFREMIDSKPLRLVLSAGAYKTAVQYEWPQVTRRHQLLYDSLYS